MGYKGGDETKGKKLAQTRAGQCHNFASGGPNGVGPNLFGIVGRTSGTVPGFAYSKANQDSGVTWTAENLDEYITNPKKFMPGNKMAFAGIKKDKDRYDLISYLETLQ
ncbi:Cytochrome c [Diplonema papillatum]|nr:Cytochrome c [Diplonema papillatum]